LGKDNAICDVLVNVNMNLNLDWEPNIQLFFPYHNQTKENNSSSPSYILKHPNKGNR